MSLIKQKPADGFVEAEYADGYVHSQYELEDQSPYEPGRNTFSDIERFHPVADHGKMVRFSVYLHKDRIDIDWTAVPENARPIRFYYFERDDQLFSDGHIEEGPGQRLMSLHVGYQWNDKFGRNHKRVSDFNV